MSNSESKRNKKSSLFSRGKNVVEHPPQFVFFDYKEGKEKAVRESLKSDMFNLVKDMDWGKSDISFRIVKVENHPRIEDGYICELQKGGDGGSYLDSVLEKFKSPEVHEIWVNGVKSSFFVEIKNGQIETSRSPVKAPSEEILLSYKNKPMKMKPLFVESYAFFYFSLSFFILSFLSVFFAAMFKYVWYDESKKFVDENYYTKDKYMPVEALKNAESTDQERIAAIRYTPNKKWFFIIEERTDDLLIEYEQKVKQDGTLSDKVKVLETPIESESSAESEITQGSL